MEGASKEEIEEAYIRLSKELDPENNDNLEFFIEEHALVQEAYIKLTGNQPNEEKKDEISNPFNDNDSIVVIMKKFRSSSNHEKFKILTFLEEHKSDSRFNQALKMIFKNEKIRSIAEFKLKYSINSTNKFNNKRTNKNKNNTPKPKSSFIKKKYIVVLLLIGIAVVPYFIHQIKIKNFKLKLPNIEANEIAKMENSKIFWTEKFKKDYPRLKSYYKDSGANDNGGLDFADAIVKKDTLIKFLFYSEKISFNGFLRDYFECAYNHESNRYRNKYNKEYSSWINKTRKKFGLGSKTLNNLINAVKQSSSNNSDFPFLNSISKTDIKCKKCISNYISASELDLSLTKDFDSFVREYLKNKRTIDNNNNKVIDNYNSKLNSLRFDLSKSLIDDLENKLKNEPILYENKANFSFSNGGNLGLVSYSFTKKEFNEKRLEKISNDIINNFYKTNSLRTGSTPYSYCYGENPSCSPPYGYAECSFIDVRASNSSDVIVIIKKNNIVYSHAYIKAGGYHKFKLGNGLFQTFFYYGNGWNPNKFMKNTTCGKIIGGFINDESLDKSELISLRNSSMSYTLYSVINGNFQPKSSNKNEAF